MAPLVAHAGWFSPDIPNLGVQRQALCVLNEMRAATSEDDVEYISRSCAAYRKDETPATAFIVPATYESGLDCTQAMVHQLPLVPGNGHEDSEQVTAACFTLYER